MPQSNGSRRVRAERSKEELREMVRRLRTLGEAVADGIFIVDSEENCIYANAALAKMTGYTEEELAAMNVRDLVDRDAFALISGQIRLRKEGKASKYEVDIRRKDGSKRTALLSDSPVFSNDGNFLGTIGIVIDVTEKRAADERLRATNALLQSLLRAIPDVVYFRDRQGRYSYINPAFESMIGKTNEEVIGKTPGEVLPPDLLQSALKSDEKVLADGKAVFSEVQSATWADGRTRIYETDKVPVLDAEGKVAGLVGVSRDVTERMRMEEELKALAKYPSENPNPIMRASNEGVVLHANPASKTFLEAWGSAVGLPLPSLLRVSVVAASASGSSKNVEVEHGGRVFLFSIVPTPGENYVNVYGRDITAIKEAERKLRRHSEELERLVSERAEKLLEVERLAAVGEIASAVGHDLRAPLQVLTSDLYLIKEKLASLPPESKKVRDELLQTMETMNLQLKYMSGIIYDLQALVGRARPQLSEADVSKLVDRTLMGMEVPPNVKIAVNVQAPAGATRANVDAVMIMRVFTNLITNAIQAMPNGGSLTITLSLKDKWLSIEFSDTGVGMSPETMRKLFTPLFTTKGRGMGLGLAICKRIVEAHGGRISTRSKAGEGTTFTVELPLPSEGKQ